MRRQIKRSRKTKTPSKVARETPYNIPSTLEKEKLARELALHRKKLDDTGRPLKLLTDSQVLGLCRGAIRSTWMYHPVKLAYFLSKVEPDNSPDTRRRWKVKCECCGTYFKKSEVVVDHIKGEYPLSKPEQILEFYKSIIDVGTSDLQVLCVECHEIKTAMERYGYSEEEVIIFKKVTKWEKAHKKVATAKKALALLGYSKGEMNNKETRRKSLWNHFENGGL